MTLVDQASSLSSPSGEIRTSPVDPLFPIQILFNPTRQPYTEDDKFSALVQRVRQGLDIYDPELCEEGENGTYFLRDLDGKRIAVWKPCDEEGSASPKHKNRDQSSSDNDDEEEFDPSKICGGDQYESAKKEVAAYLLDLLSGGFYGVPCTGLIALHSSIGSLQEFVESDGASWDVGSALFPVHEVHKIGILDIQMLNLDRHGGNILIKKLLPKPSASNNASKVWIPSFKLKAMNNGQGPTPLAASSTPSYTLIPIDHGYSLPRQLTRTPEIWFEWLSYSQAKTPFSDSTREFIESIDMVRIEQAFRDLELADESIGVWKLTTRLLKKCAAEKMTLHEIAYSWILSGKLEDEMQQINDAAVAVAVNNITAAITPQMADPIANDHDDSSTIESSSEAPSASADNSTAADFDDADTTTQIPVQTETQTQTTPALLTQSLTNDVTQTPTPSSTQTPTVLTTPTDNTTTTDTTPIEAQSTTTTTTSTPPPPCTMETLLKMLDHARAGAVPILQIQMESVILVNMISVMVSNRIVTQIILFNTTAVNMQVS